jgi:PAS domain S-box-containing protein
MQFRDYLDKLSISGKGSLLIALSLAAQLIFVLCLTRYDHVSLKLLIGGAGLSILMAIVIALLFHRLITLPLRQLAQRAARLEIRQRTTDALAANDDVAKVDAVLKQVAERLADSNAALDSRSHILQSVLASMGDAVIVAGDDGKILLMNPAARRLFGSERAFLPNSDARPPSDFAPEAVSAVPKAVLARVLGGESIDEFDVLLPPSKVRPATWVTVTGRLLHDLQYKARAAVLVSRDITERKSIEQAIRRAKIDLESKVEERTRSLATLNRELANRREENEAFVHSVSHDLRSPLVNLLGFSNELELICNEARALTDSCQIPSDVRGRLDTLLNAETPAALRFIQTAVARISGIIDALLRLSRAGHVTYQSVEVDLSWTVANVVAGLSRTINERGANVICGDLPVVIGDPTALEQVFANLIGNALNYLDPQRPGEIEIGCLPTDEHTPTGESGQFATLFVKDNGQGIPQQSTEQVFRVFQRFHPGAAPGEGIGLAMLKRIVDRHAGRIWFDSTEGVGSTFFVKIPLAARPALEPALISTASTTEQ